MSQEFQKLISFIILLNGLRCEFINFDLNDILNEQLMPAALFAENHSFAHGTNITRTQFYHHHQSEYGNIDDAMSTMKFHRQKMNEYLASNFVAKQIIGDLSLQSLPLPPKQPFEIQRRLGTVMDDDQLSDDDFDVGDENRFRIPKLNQNDDLLYDQGSVGYKDWLEKTTTFDDIQRQFGQNPYGSTKTQSTGKTGPKNASTKRQGNGETELDDEDYEEGDVTGFAYHRPVYNNQASGQFPENYAGSPPIETGYESGMRNYGVMPVPIPTAGSKNAKFYSYAAHGIKNLHYVPQISNYHPSTIPGYYHPTAQESYDHEEYGTQHHYPVQNMPSSSLKEIDLKDIINIALTTLAFLSFGMFILQVLMCITMHNSYDNPNSMMMMPMEAIPAAAENVDTVEEIRRKRRSIENDRLAKVNELSRRVLLSMDTVIEVGKDDGKCLQRVLCDNNSYARKQKDGQKLWIPVWSLGISWLSSRFSSLASILSGLKAMAVGLGGGNCTKTFAECDLNIIS